MFKTVDPVLKYDEEKLWTAVVEQAIREAIGKNKKLKESAYSWIHSSESFRTVCELANLDSKRLKNMLNKIIGKKGNFMDFASQKEIKTFLIDNIKECVSYLLSDGEFHQDKFYMGNLGEDEIIVEVKGEKAGNWYNITKNKSGDILELWTLVTNNVNSAQKWLSTKESSAIQEKQNEKKVFSVDQYLSDQSPVLQDIIAPKILTPGGLLVIGGTPKVGKSNFLLSLLVHLAAGIPFLDMKPAKPLKIFYLQNEMEYGDMRERLQQLKIDQKLFDLVKENLVITKKIKLTLNPEEIKMMIAEKFDAKTVDLIVIDAFLDYGNMLSFLKNGMDKLRSITNPMAGIIFTHYTKKVSSVTLEKNPFQALSGSNILRSAYTSGIVMFKPNERTNTLKVMYELRNSKPITKYIRKVNGCWKISNIVATA